MKFLTISNALATILLSFFGVYYACKSYDLAKNDKTQGLQLSQLYNISDKLVGSLDSLGKIIVRQDSQISNQQTQINSLSSINQNTLSQLEILKGEYNLNLENDQKRLMDMYSSILDKLNAFTFHYPYGDSKNLGLDSMKQEMSKIISFCKALLVRERGNRFLNKNLKLQRYFSAMESVFDRMFMRIDVLGTSVMTM